MSNGLNFLERSMITAEESTSASELIRMMTDHKIGAVPIMRGSELIGIVSERDIVRRLMFKKLDPDKTPAADFMTAGITAVDIKDDPVKIYDTLCSMPFRHLPILDDGKLIGMATEKDIREGLLNEDHAFRKFIFDRKFHFHKWQYVWQCALAALGIFIILLVFNAFSNAAIIAALGASSFIAFAMPHRRASKPRFLIGGYIVGIASGIICNLALSIPGLDAVPVINSCTYAVFGALAVGLSMFVMSVSDTEHPPAAGIALGLVLSDLNLRIVILILVGIVLLSLIKQGLRPYMKDLL